MKTVLCLVAVFLPAIALIGPAEVGSFYYIKLLYKIKPEERSLPSEAEIRSRCCPRAASGHATDAVPSSVMNSRRFIFRLIR